jgi:hypothetical protein
MCAYQTRILTLFRCERYMFRIIHNCYAHLVYTKSCIFFNILPYCRKSNYAYKQCQHILFSYFSRFSRFNIVYYLYTSAKIVAFIIFLKSNVTKFRQNILLFFHDIKPFMLIQNTLVCGFLVILFAYIC